MTRHTTEKDRFRIRVLYFDARQNRKEIMRTTGFSLPQIRTAIESGAVKKRSGRPSRKNAKVTATPESRSETAEPEGAQGSAEPEAVQSETAQSEAAQSEAAQSEVAQSEAARSQSAEPVTTETEAAEPEASPESAPQSAPETTEADPAEQLVQVVAKALQ